MLPAVALSVAVLSLITIQNRSFKTQPVAGGTFMALTKTEITETIQKKLNLSRNTSYNIMEDFLEIIKKSLEQGEDVMISGFGKFCVNEKKARKGRNPATNEEMKLPARRVVTFKCSGKLRNLINVEDS